MCRRDNKDSKKLQTLCQDDKFLALNEITRIASCNQLDHILLDKKFKDKYFATSFHNFISDHKSIDIRLGGKENYLTIAAKQRITFDAELHLKSRNVNAVSSTNTAAMTQSEPIMSTTDAPTNSVKITQSASISSSRVKKVRHPSKKRSLRSFNRKIRNPDMATCWLNACLQLIFTAFDHSREEVDLISELGSELW